MDDAAEVVSVDMKAAFENRVKEETMMQTQLIEEHKELRSGRSSYQSGRSSPRFKGAIGGLYGLALRPTSLDRCRSTSVDRQPDANDYRHDMQVPTPTHSHRSRGGSMSSHNSCTKEERLEVVTTQSRDNNAREAKDKTYSGGVLDLFSERSSPPGSPMVLRDLSLSQRRDNNAREAKDKTYSGGVIDLFSERSSPPGSPMVRRVLSLSQRSREDNNARVRIEEDYSYGSMEDSTMRVHMKEGYEEHILSHGNRRKETNQRIRLEDGYDSKTLNTTEAILKMNREDLLKLSRLHINGSSDFKDKETWLRAEEQWITEQIKIEEEVQLRQEREERRWCRQREKIKEQQDALVRKEALELYCTRHGFPNVHEARKQGCAWRPARAPATYALHNAAMNNDIRIVEMLIQERASRIQRDSAGLTAEQVASKRNRRGSHDGVIRLLWEAHSPKHGGGQSSLYV